MANPATPCSCVPYDNLCCCPPQNGVAVTQPVCQTLPNGDVVNNPAYVADSNLSYWTYKFFTDCAQATRGISSVAIPICENINEGHVVVEEKIDGCGTFQDVSFEINKTDTIYGTAP